MTAENINERNLTAEITNFREYLREDYDAMSNEIDAEFQALSKEQALRIEVDNSLESALKELESLQSQLPKEQMNALFEQCSQNAIDAVVGHFGLAAVVADSKDGGKSTTPNNFKNGDIDWTNKDEVKAYEQWAKINKGDIAVKDIRKKYYNAKTSNYRTQKESEFGGKDAIIKDGYTGKDIAFKDTDTEHIVSVSTIENDPKNHLYLNQKERVEMASNEANFTFTDSSINRSKSDSDLKDWQQTKRDSGKTNADHFGIDNKLTNKQSKEAQGNVWKHRTPKAIEKHATEILDIENVAHRNAKHLSSAIGLILKEFIQRMLAELKILFSNFGDESLGDIFKRFYKALGEIWDSLKPKLKSLISNVLEMEVFTLVSNIVVFIINLFCRTIKSVVRIIKVGLKALYDAIKILLDKNRPQDERMFAAAEVFVYGLVSGLTILSSEAITKGLYTIPYLNAILALPISPDETIGDALGLCISAALGAVLSTIAIYYMDKWANDKKIAGLQIQMIAQSGIVVRCQVVKSWFSLLDAWRFLEFAIEDT